eukprot:scaffold69632_cov18-Prasinocladus_malaysianus.AAC.1
MGSTGFSQYEIDLLIVKGAYGPHGFACPLLTTSYLSALWLSHSCQRLFRGKLAIPLSNY